MTKYRVQCKTNHGGVTVYIPQLQRAGQEAWEDVPWHTHICGSEIEARAAIQTLRDREIAVETFIEVG